MNTVYLSKLARKGSERYCGSSRGKYFILGMRKRLFLQGEDGDNGEEEVKDIKTTKDNNNFLGQMTVVG